MFRKVQLNSGVDVDTTNCTPLQQADGKSLKKIGSCLLPLQIGPILIDREVTIADISDDVLLGIDIPSIDVMTSRGIVKINDQEIEALQVRSESSRQVRLTEDAVIPAYSEAILNVSFTTNTKGDEITEAVVEPSESFMEEHSLIIATSLVDLSETPTGVVRIINPGTDAISVRKNTNVGVLESFEFLDQILEEDSEPSEGGQTGLQRHGLFEFKYAPFGLCNMPACFQRIMELALQGLQWTSCLIYLDDIIIFGNGFEQHLQRLRAVLTKIKNANFKLKPEKCNLFQPEVEFLGHIVSKEGVKPNPYNTMKIQNWTSIENVSEARQYLGLCSYYRRFVKNFSAVAKPIIDLTKKDSPLVWTAPCQKAFDELKSALLGPNIMAYPLDQGDYIVDTDASDFAIGAVLSQIQDGQEKVIAYASRTLNRAERNYCVTDRELLADLS